MYLDIATKLKDNSILLIIIGITILLISFGVIIYLGIKNRKKEVKEDEEII